MNFETLDLKNNDNRYFLEMFGNFEWNTYTDIFFPNEIHTFAIVGSKLLLQPIEID